MEQAKKQTKTLLTGVLTPSTDVEILQRLEATKALLQSITDIKNVRTIIPDLEKWEQNEIEMKYSCEVCDISNLVRDCTARLKNKYYQETGLYLPPIQGGSSLGVRVGWLRFVDIHLIGKESQTNAENIAAAVSRDSAAILTGKEKPGDKADDRAAQEQPKPPDGPGESKGLSKAAMVRSFKKQNPKITLDKLLEQVNTALVLNGQEETTKQYIKNVLRDMKKNTAQSEATTPEN